MSTPIYGSTNLAPSSRSNEEVKRFASVIEISPEKESYYRQLHADVWPSVLKQIKQSHIRNYSIYFAPIAGKIYLFSYFEYSGKDFTSDIEKMAADLETQRWWAECKPCQIPLENNAPGEWWKDLEEVFHFNS